MNMPLIRKLLQDAIKGGVSVRKLATLIGISRTSIIDYIKGNTIPTPGTVSKIARYFKIRSEILFSDDNIIDITPEMKQLPAPSSATPPSADTLLIQSLMDRMTGLEKRLDEQKARLDDSADRIRTHKDGMLSLVHRMDTMQRALQEAGRTGDLAVLETLGDKG